MEKDINSCFFRTLCVRLCVLFLLFVPLQARAVGWTPTDAGLIVDLKPGDKIMLSVWIDLDGDKVEDEGEEYFVCHYNLSNMTKTPPFYYANGHFLKLIPQATDATEPSPTSVWTIDTALIRTISKTDYALGGKAYTMWNKESQDSKDSYTLVTTSGNFKFLGDLSSNQNDDNLCDVAFAVPTVRALTNMDPNGTLNDSHTDQSRNRGTGSQSWAFDGKTGTGFLGKTYREVYWFDIPRSNPPYSYANAALVTFNTTNSEKKWSDNQITCKPGKAAYAYADNKHKPTTRTLFRLYILEKEPFRTCPDSYFFAYDEQDYVKYRQSTTLTDSTTARKIYTTDYIYRMDHVGDASSKKYQTDYMKVPVPDSAYYYVGKNDKYYSDMAGESATPFPGATYSFSQFTKIRQLPILNLAGKVAPAGACGRMVVADTTVSGTSDAHKYNLDVKFEPAGYFLRVHTTDGKDLNIPMHQTGDNEWTGNEVWQIKPEFVTNTIKVMLYTGPTFSLTDPGVDVADWSVAVAGSTIKVHGTGADVTNQVGFPRIYTNNTDPNGALDFVLAATDRHVHYNNNGHFGDTIPDQYPISDSTTVTAEEPRLLPGYRFIGWTTLADTTTGSFTKYQPGATITLSEAGTLTLYAQAKYEGSIHVAISFLKDDGKRYFLTHPNTETPRYARTRYFDNWTDVYQGMSDAANTEPNYITSYKLIGKDTETECGECGAGEYVFDAHREVMNGATDSLVFYENFSGGTNEYIGLYYAPGLSSVLANNTWAGLFKSTVGWPTPVTPCIDSTRLVSTNYLTGLESTPYTHSPRHTGVAVKDSVIHYNSASDQFDEGEIGAGTDFMLSGVGVVDAHYVILPDTLDEERTWRNAITFGYHAETPDEELVWSRLIGKQLLAQMKVGNDTIYFHPNRDKIYTTANDLRLSSDFRLTQSFTLIHDKRPSAALSAGDSVSIEEIDNGFGCRVIGGAHSPIGVQNSSSQYIDIVDTLRVTLRPMGTSKIKDYYGRWKKGAAGLHTAADGTRYRDILITTNTYHYGDASTRLVLASTQDSYIFSPLVGTTQKINFTLKKQTFRQLLTTNGTVVGEEVVESEDITTSYLRLAGSHVSFKVNQALEVVTEKTVTDSVTIRVKDQNDKGINYDTIIVTIPSITVEGQTYSNVSDTIPVIQASLDDNQLIWSVVDDGKRYFIMAGSSGLIFRQYTTDGSTLYKYNNKGTHLVKGSANAANNDAKYITPWIFTYPNETDHPDQLTLSIASPVSKALVISGTPATLGVGETASATILTYELDTTYVNDNANYEEKVRLHYGSGTGTEWLKFTGGATPSLSLVEKANATVFSWGYLQQEYNLLNNGTYPSTDYAIFNYNSTAPATITAAYQAYREYSMLLDNKLTYLCRETEKDAADLDDDPWKTTYSVDLITDARTFDGGSKSSGLSKTTTNFTTTITPSGDSPTNVTISSKYVNIVDTLRVTLGLGSEPPAYRFKGDWSSYTSVSDACLKIPLIRKTYHSAHFDIVSCAVDKDEYNYTFPATLPTGAGKTAADSSHTFTLNSIHTNGTNILDVDNNVVSSSSEEAIDLTAAEYGMDLNDPAQAEIRLIDSYGNTPTWCEISAIGRNTVTIKCTANGIRTPRTAYLYLAYIVYTNTDKAIEHLRFVNFQMTVSQPSHFDYANNQILVHSTGITGDPLLPDGRQQAHENKRILYYYNPKPYAEPDQNVELPVRERGYYGWWRWYREGKDQNHHDVSDTDIPDSVWQTPPRNVGKKPYVFPYRIIGDSVWNDEADHSKGKKLVTMGRYTVFHYPAYQYGNKADPPSKTALVYPPFNKDTVTYVVDLSNYYDNLRVSMSAINQIDTAWLDTVRQIPEPTLSLREAFELHPWTEMAERMENYKSAIPGGGSYTLANEHYMEDHVVMAPAGKRLLLRTEQRYSYENLKKKGHSESLLGYYMRDDNWSTVSWSDQRKDTMIWCGGWDADCEWYIYTPTTTTTGTYTRCNYKITVDDDFLDVPSGTGKAGDTVYYCLRARSKSTTTDGTEEHPDPDEPDDGNYYFNICRYKVIYHEPRTYGPWEEHNINRLKKAIITNDEIERNYEVLERLNFDYNRPGKEYQVYPHPLPWADASYGYSYPVTDELPDNRYHNDFALNFPGVGEYGLINYINNTKYWNSMEQHGGKENGYMIYCDGMSSAGQVAALSLETHLCEGQRMYFSAYVGNVSSQTGKSNPNFTISVQGSTDGENWQDITTYMTGDIPPSKEWYQIYFPITYESSDMDYFRVRVYNVASDFDGNDFVLDDMCIFATKPPLIAYQANTSCLGENESDSVTHVVVRVDYQGFVNEAYNGEKVFYTVEGIKNSTTSFVPMIDSYLNEVTKEGSTDAVPDTIYGFIPMPQKDYVPMDEDSIFDNLRDMVTRFDTTLANYLKKQEAETLAETDTFFNKGYLYEILDGKRRPVLYVLHKAKMKPDNRYNVRMSLSYKDLLSSICAMTSAMKVTNPMMLELNGEEQTNKELVGLCANTTYDISLRVKGTLFDDNTAPYDMDGSCYNDWLLYGDSTSYSTTRYGYPYRDIASVIEILRYDSTEGVPNENRFARSLAEVNHNTMLRVQQGHGIKVNGIDNPESGSANDPYVILTNLVNNGFLTLFKSKITATVTTGDSIQYMIFPIEGTGSDLMSNRNMEVCPQPMFIKLKPSRGGAVPMMIGGLKRDSTEAARPVVVLADASTANSAITIRIDSLMNTVAIHSITLLSTTDTNYLEGVHTLNLTPDRIYNLVGDNSGYYKKGDNLVLHPASSYTYRMLPGYSYTFGIRMQTRTGSLTVSGSDCEVGTIPFTVSVVPDRLLWNPQVSGDSRWNNPANWIGIDEEGNIIDADAHFAPLPTTNVIIAAPTGTQHYPVIPDPSTLTKADSVIQVGFQYNTCNDIRFLPGAAMSQQQLLTYTNAVVDMDIPQRTWALRSAPVTGMLSGDIFMADADLNGETLPWEVGQFDASGRSYQTGNASYWLSVYNTASVKNVGTDGSRTDLTADASWSRVTNGMTLSLPPAQGWAIYGRTASGEAAAVRLPKGDDIYYYFNADGSVMYELYENNLQALRNSYAGGTAGKLAFDAASETYTLRNAVASTSFVFGNPTMGYIDIWGFIADNTGLVAEIGYLNAGGKYIQVTQSAAEADPATNIITNRERYLPPMHAVVLTTTEAATAKELTLSAGRVVTAPVTRGGGGSAPARLADTNAKARAIMTVTAVNNVSDRCVSRLLLGQGYHDAILSGEDAVLTTVNIDRFSMTNTPTTPFNIYASRDGYGLSIDLSDSLVYVPLSFYMSNLPYDPVTQLWFTGVNAIEGPLVLYDAFLGTERLIIDGICLDIETPEMNHEMRYYIRRPGYSPQHDSGNPVVTGILQTTNDQQPTTTYKIFRNGHVYILRNGHVYTMFGQQIR